MSRSNDEKTREFQKKMRTQGAAGFGAGPWKDVEESLGMDQSVVVDQDGNPVWSVQHTRKPRHTVSRSTFDRLLGGVAVLAIATLLTSVLAIYYEQTHDIRISSLFAGSEPGNEPDTGNTITLQRPPTSGFIDRPAIEVVEKATGDRDIMTGSLETGTPAATRDALPESPEAATGQALVYAEPVAAVETPDPATESTAATDRPDTPAYAEPVAVVETPGPVTKPAAATDRPDKPAGVAAMTEPAVLMPGTHAPDSSSGAETPAAAVDALAAIGPDTAEAIETITRQESPAAIAGSTASADMADEAPSGTMPTTAPATSGQAAPMEPLAAIEPAAGPDVTLRTAEPVTAEVPEETPAMSGTGTAGATAATESPDRPEEPVSPVPATAGMAADTPGANPVSQTGTVSPTETPDSGTPQLALLEPASSSPSPASEAAMELRESTAVTMDDVPLPGATGRWIINLASYAGPKTADRMQRKFEDLGVSTDRQIAEVNGRTMYRLRIASFKSRQDAEAYFDSIKDTLGLKSAWITKK